MGSTAIDRQNLKAVYPGPTWATKVDKMSDAQVIAVLRRIQNQKKN